MGIIKLSFLTVGAMGIAMLHFGRDEDLPADRLGLEPGLEQSTIEPVSAAVTAPVVLAPVLVKPVKAVLEIAPPAPDTQAGRAVAAAKLMAASAAAPATAKQVQSEFPTVFVRASAVNLRAGPSTRNGIIGRLIRGTKVLQMGEAAPGWSQIRVVDTGERGFMASKFLTQPR